MHNHRDADIRPIPTSGIDYVVCVDEHDQVIGVMEKMAAHKQGVLHRAFSVHIYRYHKGELQFLLQQRAPHKYHSADLWSNACCSHPRMNESLLDACIRRLREEINITSPLALHTAGSFIYKAHLDHGLIEHECDHVFYACFEGDLPAPNKDEVSDLKWVSNGDIESKLYPLTAWFEGVHRRVLGAITPCTH